MTTEYKRGYKKALSDAGMHFAKLADSQQRIISESLKELRELRDTSGDIYAEDTPRMKELRTRERKALDRKIGYMEALNQIFKLEKDV